MTMSVTAAQTFAPPGPGSWFLDPTHWTRPVTRFQAEIFPDAFRRGFGEGLRRYGSLLEYLDAGFVNGLQRARASAGRRLRRACARVDGSVTRRAASPTPGRESGPARRRCGAGGARCGAQARPRGGWASVDANGSRTRRHPARLPVVCAGVLVEPGDIVLGDDDGVVVVPRRIASEIVDAAGRYLEGENAGRALFGEQYVSFGVKRQLEERGYSFV